MGINENDFEYYQKHVLGDNDTFKFTCKQCGSCCRKRSEPIVITGVDMFYIAKELGMTPIDVAKEFTSSYIGDTSRIPVHVLVERLDGSCKLLRNGRCSVHKSKPVVCALYPLGRFVINGETKFNYFCQPHSCPGSQNGEEHTLSEWLAEYDLRQRDAECVAWNKLMMDTSGFIRGIESKFSAQFMNTIWNACDFLLYVGYNPEADLLGQINEMAKKLVELSGIVRMAL